MFDTQGHLKETVPTHHPFKKILALTYYPQPDMTETIEGPNGNVTMTTATATRDAYFHLCETASLVNTKWFALTDNYHIIKAPVSVLMETSDKPVLPYVLRNSKYCGERPNCEASMEQAETLFSITLNYHHDKYEVLYNTEDAKKFCRKPQQAPNHGAIAAWLLAQPATTTSLGRSATRITTSPTSSLRRTRPATAGERGPACGTRPRSTPATAAQPSTAQRSTWRLSATSPSARLAMSKMRRAVLVTPPANGSPCSSRAFVFRTRGALPLQQRLLEVYTAASKSPWK